MDAYLKKLAPAIIGIVVTAVIAMIFVFKITLNEHYPGLFPNILLILSFVIPGLTMLHTTRIAKAKKYQIYVFCITLLIIVQSVFMKELTTKLAGKGLQVAVEYYIVLFCIGTIIIAAITTIKFTENEEEAPDEMK